MEICFLPSSTIPTSFSKPGILEKSSMHAQLLRFPNFGKKPPARKLNILDVKAQSSARMLGIDKSSIHGQLLKFPNFSQNPPARKLKLLDVRAQSSGITKSSLGAVEAIPEVANVKDDNVAFVAGATGKVGSRTVRELIKLGFRVRAGVRSAQGAQTLVQSVKRLKLDEGEGIQSVEKLEIVECDLEKPKEIVPALGNASIVFCCIGASEKEVFDITGPYRIDYMATKNLIDAARYVKVKHFFLVSSLGTNKIGFPAAILNLFWGVLLWKRKAEEALIASGIPYTIVRPGGMERPTDAYKETHNLVLCKEDTLFGGQVSNLQVAELMAFMARNLELSYCEVVEVIAETTAPLTPLDKLLEKIPSQRAPPKEPIAKKSPKSGPKPATVTKVATEPPSPTPSIEKEPELPKPVVSRPLSPYAAYDDLKPPTSPTPTQATCQKESVSSVDTTPEPKTTDAQTISSVSTVPETKPSPVEAKIERPLSPYAAYPDLKPPSSPSPSSSGPKKVPLDATSSGAVESLAVVGSDVAKEVATSNSGDNASVNSASYQSPYMVYDNRKPPTSPSPSSTSVSSSSGEPKVVNSAPPPATQSDEKHEAGPGPKQKPLSPYAMYEDLKPPTSPSPSHS